MRSKVLWRRSIGFRLAFFACFNMSFRLLLTVLIFY